MALLLVVLLLAGCANKAPAQTEPEKSVPEQAAPAAEPATEAAQPPEVENNGGHYVRVGDKIYFRRYGADALSRAATFGEFTEAWNVAGESELMCYDRTTDELTALYTESGGGALWYGDGGFYLGEQVNDKTYTTWFALDGSGAREICEGSLLGITDGGLLAVERAEYEPEYAQVFCMYRDGVLLSETRVEDIMRVAGVTDDGIFLLSVGYYADSEADALWQITPEGKQIRLGALPELDEDTRMYTVSQVDRFLAADGKVTIGVGYYAGTGHFFDSFVFAEATVGQADSLTAMEKDPAWEEAYELPRLTRDEAGGVAFSEALPGELRIDWGEPDVLQVWEDDSWQTLAEGLTWTAGDGWGSARIAQEMDYVDGAAYLTLAVAAMSPADAIGWRDAYALLHMLYLRVDRDGTVRELSSVDHKTVLFGSVWFVEGASVALWQQLTSVDGEGWFDTGYIYAFPIADDAFWDEGAFDGVTGLLPGDYGEGQVDYYGYPTPDTEPAGQLSLALDRDCNITALLRKDPDAALNIDFDVPEDELRGAVETLALARRDSDEDTPWYWTKLTSLEDGLHVRIERTPENVDTTEFLAMIYGDFVAGETVYDGTLNCGEYLALRASLPWHPEMRVTVGKNGAWGDYVFGEDNYMHLESEDGVHPGLTLATYPLESPDLYDEGSLPDALSGTWLYHSPLTGRITALLTIDGQGGVTVTRDDEAEEFTMSVRADRLYAEEWGTPDLMCLSSDDPRVIDEVGFGGNVGDYCFELFRTDGEEVLRLIQANNGDGALSALLPDAADGWRYDFVFTRSRGAGDVGVHRRGATFPAEIVRCGDGVLWLCEVEKADESEELGTVWRPISYAPCLPYAAEESVVKFRDDYPMQVLMVTVDQNGTVTKLEAIE